MRAAIRTFKDRLSEFVRLVQKGEEIVLTSRNRPVANLLPLGPEDMEPGMSRAELARDLRRLRESLTLEPAAIPLSETVARLRREARH